MFTFSQYPYKKISNILMKAKKSRERKEIIQALISFTDILYKTISNISSYKPLILFTIDPNMIFPGKHRELSTEKLETEITSSGYIDQLLEIIGIYNHREISDSISDAISDLHADMSRGIKDISEKKEILINSINNLKKVLQDLVY